MITEDYVSFETAKLLKEKRFDERCLYYYEDNTSYNNVVIKFSSWFDNKKYSNSEIGRRYTAPTLQMAMKWLREVYKIFIEISVSIDLNGNYHYSYFILNRECKYIRKGYTDFNWNYEQACEAALKYCLENII